MQAIEADRTGCGLFERPQDSARSHRGVTEHRMGTVFVSIKGGSYGRLWTARTRRIEANPAQKRGIHLDPTRRLARPRP